MTLDGSDLFDFTVIYNGFIGTPAGVVAGLTANIDFSFLGTSGGGTSYNFSYVLTNTSGAPITASRVSIFGMNADPDIVNATSGGLFPDAVFSGPPGINVPNAGPNVDFCFKDANGAGCTGGSNGGVTLGNSGNGTFSLIFGSAPGTMTLSNFYIRYQSIASSAPIAGDSASGLGTAIPEPATWAMMIGGFGLIGAAMRRKTRLSTVAA